MTASPPDILACPTTPPRARPGRPDWAQDGHDWPNRETSRFVSAGGFRWHVQISGQGPVLLLIHGTGAATHSWRDSLRPLAEHFTVIAPDLPGHGFTEQPEKSGMTLPGMAAGLQALLARLGKTPDYAAGHSAGAAILAQMCLEGFIAPKRLISLNGAMFPIALHGIAAPLLGPIAKLIAANPLVPLVFAWQAADGAVVRRLLNGTGSAIDPAGEKFYGRLARRSGHAGAALTMMANWDLATFSARLPALKTDLLLVVGENDRTIPPGDAVKLQAMLPAAQIITWPGLGHLAHEEQPGLFVDLIQRVAQ